MIRRLVAWASAVAVCLPMLLAPPAAADDGCAATVKVGTSRRGTSIVACQLRGSDAAADPLLVVGSMHGNEKAGMRIVSRLKQRDLAGLVANIWVIRTINPDGTRVDTRGNARRVDLNGNFPTRNWHQRYRGTAKWGGPKAASEPETRALMKAVRRLRPAEVVVFHQALNLIDCPPYRSTSLTRSLRELTGYRAKCLPVLTGNFTAWANGKYPGTTAVTFELEATPSAARLDRVADGMVALAGR